MKGGVTGVTGVTVVKSSLLSTLLTPPSLPTSAGVYSPSTTPTGLEEPISGVV